MAIISASIEANGWVLAIVHSAGPGSFASYTLDPSGTPRCKVTSSHPGYAPVAGAAVATSTARTLIGTKPVRRPVEATDAGVRLPKAIDETDLGGGQTRVRIALSQHVYAADTSLTLTVLAGWRSGEGAASGIAVANSSTLVAPQPIARWIDVPLQRVTGPFDLEVLAYSHHPNGLAPVAGVKFTVTDGTTVKTFWTTALSTSTKYADGQRCYKVTVDARTATALTMGMLRCDFEVFPWIGAPRVSDPAGTKAMAGLSVASTAAGSQIPFSVLWDPNDNCLGAGVYYVYVAPGGTTTASAVAASTDPAVAAVGTPAANWNVARQALQNLNRTIPAANGQPAVTKASDACVVRVRPGGAISSSTGSGGLLSTLLTWDIIEGDPANPNPRVNCVLERRGGSGAAHNRCLIRNLQFLVTSTAAFITCQFAWFDNVEVTGAPGLESTAGIPVTFSGNSFHYYTNTRLWKGTGAIDSGNSAQAMLARNCEVERALGAITVLNCKRLSTAKAGAYAVIAAGTSLDRIVAGNDLRYVKGSRAYEVGTTSNAGAPASLTLGTSYSVASRQVFAENVVEVYGASQPLFTAIGENTPKVSTENIVEGNVLAGDRLNLWYDDLNLATVALNDSESSVAQVNRFANNAVQQYSIKTDFYDDDVVRAQRAAAGDPRKHGFRPNALRSWPMLYGVGHEGNIIFSGNIEPDFLHEFEGLYSNNLTAEGGAAVSTQYVLDKSGTDITSRYDPANTGGGNYQPTASSPALGRARSGNSDRDRRGAARVIPFAAGAIQGVGGSVIALLPDASRQTTRATSAAVGSGLTIAPAPARSATRAASGGVGSAAVVAVTPGRLTTRAASSSATVSIAVSPANARAATRASSTVTAAATRTITAPTDRTLVVAGDLLLGVGIRD